MRIRFCAAVAVSLLVSMSLSAVAGEAELLPVSKADGYRGIWYSNQPQKDEYAYKYSGGLGTYPTNHRPFAIYRPEVEKTFFCYGGTVEGNKTLLHMVSYYDHRTGTVPRPTILLDKRTDDAHDNPVMAIDDRGILWIFSSAHGTSRPAYISRSVEPYSIDAFERVVVTNYSYPQPWFLPGKGFLFLHTLYGEGGRRLFQSTSTDGIHWTEPVKRSFMELGHYEMSWPHQGKVGTAFNFHPKPVGLNARTNMYYMETDDFGRTWHTASGEPLELPLTDPASPALVHDYRSQGLLAYQVDIAFDAQGRPALLYVTSRGYESGPKNDPRTWRVARWTGEEWSIHDVTTSDNNYDAGSLYIEDDGTWRIIGTTQPGPQAYNTGGEVAMWVSRDTGATWTLDRQLTRDSRYNHTYCRKPLHAQPDFYALWADGHGRQVSPSHLYFCNQQGDVFLLPPEMPAATAKPEKR